MSDENLKIHKDKYKLFTISEADPNDQSARVTTENAVKCFENVIEKYGNKHSMKERSVKNE